MAGFEAGDTTQQLRVGALLQSKAILCTNCVRDDPPPFQYPHGTIGCARAGRRQGAAHVCLRAHGLRLRPHRQLPHLSANRRSAALSAPERHGRAPRDEHYRRGRQDHPQRGRGQHLHRRLHVAICRRVFRGFGSAARGAAGGDCPRHRTHSADGGADREARCERERPTK